MTKARIHGSETYETMKGAVRDLISAAGGPRRCQGITRGTESLLSRYGARQEEVHAPIDVIADLEKDAGEPIVTRFLAELQGYRLAPMASKDAKPDWLGHLTSLIESSGDVHEGLLHALGDSQVTQAEASVEKARAVKLKERLSAYIASLDLVIDGGTG